MILCDLVIATAYDACLVCNSVKGVEVLS